MKMDVTLFAIFSLESYKNKPKPPAGWHMIMDSKLETFTVAKSSKAAHKGYRAVVFQSDDRSTTVVAHRGTVNNVDNYLSDTCILFELPIHSAGVADKFIQHLCERHPSIKPTTLLHTGHSLGGVHAHMCAAKDQAYAISFDNPGCRKQCFAINASLIKAHHVAILSADNLVNRTGHHFGRVFQMIAEDICSRVFTLTLKRHRLEKFIIPRLKESQEPFSPFGENELLPSFLQEIDVESSRSICTPLPASSLVPPSTNASSTPLSPLVPELKTQASAAGCRVYFDSWLKNHRSGKPWQITESYWVVSLIDTRGGRFGHSKLVVESLQNSKAHIGYYHITSPDGTSVKVHITEGFAHRSITQYKSYRSWLLSADDVKKMVCQIYLSQQDQDALEYKIIQLTINDRVYNCTTWCISMLGHAGISPVEIQIGPYKPSKAAGRCLMM